MWKVAGPGNIRATQRQIEDMIASFVRKSEFSVHYIFDEYHVVIDFPSAATAKRALHKLEACHGRMGPVHWRCIQWWPAPRQWASVQLSMLRDEAKRSKTEEKEQRRRMYELRMEREREEQLQRQADQRGDCWSDDDDDDDDDDHQDEEGRNIDDKVDTGKLQGKSLQTTLTGRLMRQRSAPYVWNNLCSPSS